MSLKHELQQPGSLGAACCVTALLASLISPSRAEESTVENRRPDDQASILHYGPFDVFPFARMGLTYDNNIYIQPTGQKDDFIWSFTPGVVLGGGDYKQKIESFTVIEYSPNFLVFTKNSRNNAIDHDGKLNLEYRPGNWVISLEQLYQAYSGPVVDVGNRIDRTLYNTALGAKYEISPKTVVGVDFTQSIDDYSKFNSYNEWTLGAWGDYWITPKIKLGLGATKGWVDVANSPNQHYEQVLLRAGYTLTEKVDARASAGLEWRHFDAGAKARLNGVFSLGATYKPLEKTQVLVDAYRRNQTSVVLQDQTFTTTGFTVGIKQAVTERINAGISGGFEHRNYFANSTSVTATRVDNYYFARPTVEWNLDDHLSIGAFYQYRKNTSRTGAFEFTQHQGGANVSYSF